MVTEHTDPILVDNQICGPTIIPKQVLLFISLSKKGNSDITDQTIRRGYSYGTRTKSVLRKP